MAKQHYDPITRRWLSVRRVDLTAPAYQQATAPNAYVEALGERVTTLERRGA